MKHEPAGAEGAQETIEDLEAPAATLGNVVGGGYKCIDPTCSDTVHGGFCQGSTCQATQAKCDLQSHAIILYEA